MQLKHAATSFIVDDYITRSRRSGSVTVTANLTAGHEVQS